MKMIPWIYFLLPSIGICTRISQNFLKTSIVTADITEPLFMTKSRSSIECCATCNKHSLCIQTLFNKTTGMCTGLEIKAKGSTIVNTHTTSYERPCKSLGFTRLANSTLCIKVIVDYTIKSWYESFERCLNEGLNIGLVDVTTERDFYSVIHYLGDGYIPIEGTTYVGTFVGIRRFSAHLPWKGILSQRVLNISTSWGSVVDNDNGLCLCFWKWHYLSLDDVVCDYRFINLSVQPVICQEHEFFS